VSDVWVTIAALAVVTVLIKAAGPLTVGGRDLPPRVTAVIELMAPALLTALVLQETFSEDGELVIDARAAGLAAALLAVAARLPMMGVVTAAAVATALTRAVA
jgi:uncharacterized membrane protein